MFDKYKKQHGKNLISIKVIGYLLVIQSITMIIYESVYRISRVEQVKYITSTVIIYSAITIITILAIKLSYFKNWLSKDFKWNTRNGNVEEDSTYMLFYISTILMYIVGLFIIGGRIEGYNLLLMILSTIAIMVVQSMELLKRQENSEYIGVWEGFKYILYMGNYG